MQHHRVDLVMSRTKQNITKFHFPLKNFELNRLDSICQLLDELNKRQFLKTKGRPPYSVEMICYGLHLRHTTFQAYKQLLKKFPLPSISLLNKIQQEGVNPIKAIKILRENDKVSNDCILMVDEMYLKKATQYHSGEYVGADDEGNLCKGIVAFMIVGLKESIPYTVQAIPEVKFSGEWLADKMSNCTDDIASAEFCARGIVTDNHVSNEHAFSSLTAISNSDLHQYINHSGNFGKKKYLFYDTVHIMNNIRNNLLNGKKFIFPEFIYNDGLNIDIHFQ